MSTKPLITPTPASWSPLDIDTGSGGDYAISNRESAFNIQYVVIHTTEGNSAFDANQHWANSVNAGAHYIIDGGTIYQVVADKDIAYHATHLYYNQRSIGIEIVGFAGTQSTISDAEFRAAADLVRWLGETYNIPLVHISGNDRSNENGTNSFVLQPGIVGHNQVYLEDVTTKTDPGFSEARWNDFISLVNGGSTDDYLANTSTTGVVTPGGGQVSGNIETTADRDWFRVQVTQGSTYTINLVSGSVPQVAPFLGDPEVYLYNSSGQLLDSNDDFGGLNSQLTFTATYTGNYFVGAGEHGDNATGTYRVSVSAGSAPVAFAVSPQSGAEGSALTFRISIQNPNYALTPDYLIYYNTTNGTATVGSDYNGITNQVALHFMASSQQFFDVSVQTLTDSNPNEGSEAFNFNIYDFQHVFLKTAQGTINDVALPNQAPDAKNDQFTAQQAQTISGSVLVNNGFGADSDPENDPLTVDFLNNAVTTAGGHVTLNTNGSFQYTAPASGSSDSFNYTLRDDHGHSDVATVNITLNAQPNQAPDAKNDQFTAQQAQTISGSVLVNNGFGADSDPENDPLTVDFLNNAVTTAGGHVTLNTNGSFQYTAPASGSSDSFNYTLRDNHGHSDVAIVNITLSGHPNQPDLVAGINFINISNFNFTGVSSISTGVSYFIQNNGDVTASPSVAKIYLSTDNMITASDTLLTSVNEGTIQAGVTLQDSASITLTNTLSPGTYWIGLITDGNGQVAESNESNNTSSPVQITVTAPAGPVSINDVTITEGDSGAKVASFTVTRTGGTEAFDINFTTADGSATVADPDYVAKSGTLHFGTGVNTQPVSVTLNGDTKFESNETFFVNLSGATNGATISDSQGVGTIINDEPLFPAFTFELANFAPGAGGWNSENQYPREVADVNGDGMADIVAFGANETAVSLATGNGHFASPVAGISNFGYLPAGGGWVSQDQYPRLLADVNGDGRADIVAFGANEAAVSLATGNGHFASPISGIQNFAFLAAGGGWVSENQYPRQLADVNGDGMADIVGFAANGVEVSLATGGGHFASPISGIQNFGYLPAGGGWVSQDQYPRLLADVNGDGMADIVGFGANEVAVSLATGGGHFASPVLGIQNFAFLPAGGGWVSQNQYPRLLADVNGDHMADIVGFSADGAIVSLATGGGHFASPVAGIQNFGFLPAGGGWVSQDLYPRALGDVNGDHAADIIGFGHDGVFAALSNGFHLV